jgi:hypothetical protein
MSGHAEAEDRVNMIPLIDCMFFLILFFMIITKFEPDEKAVASLLPTDKGQMNAKPTSVAPVEQINLLVYPQGVEKGYQPSEYRKQLEELEKSRSFFEIARIRVGGRDPIEINGLALAQRSNNSEQMRDNILQAHAYIKEALNNLEEAGKPRKEQKPVVISCYSGMPWKYALLVYDAVRAYEAEKTGSFNKNTFDLLEAREVSFAPPQIRNFHKNELGNELYTIVNMR